MPKLRIRAKGARRSSARNVQRKFLVGTRKGGVSALQMSTEALKTALIDPNKKRYISNIRAALKMRGITA
jgi:hypothetical protein